MFFKTRLLKLMVPALVLALMASFIGPGAGTAQANPGWYNAGWSFRKPVTINAAQVSGSANLTGFPVMIQVTDANLAAFAQADGDDILFTLDDEVTKLSHEIEYFDKPSGNLTAWVKMPSLSPTTDTTIYMYYNNPSATNQENVTAVWDSSFKMVQHMEETGGGANAVTDSTGNNNDGTDNNTPSFSATGQADGAIGFSSGDVIQVADSASLDIASAITLEAWVYPTTLDTVHRRIVVKSHTSWAEPYYMYSLWVHSAGLGFGTYNGTARNWQTNGTLTADTWQHVVGTQDATGQRWYINGTQVAVNPINSVIATNNQPLLIGNTNGSGLDFLGTIDELRVSSTARSADWIQTSYNNQNAPASFLTFGTPEYVPTTPSVETGPATLVEETTATLNGIIMATGGDTPDMRGFEWWPTGVGATANWTESGSFGTGAFSHAVSGLDKGKTYSYRAMAHNLAGWNYGPIVHSFITKPDPPSSLAATAASSSQIDLTWAKGAGANVTIIQGRYDTYPTSVSDGFSVYLGTGTAISQFGLPPNTTVYYAAWSGANEGYGYSALSDDPPAYANATTGSGAPAVPTVIGGVVLKVNKATLLAPWIGIAVAALLLTRLFFYLRRRQRY